VNAYRVVPGVPRELVAYVSGLLAAERRARGTRTGTRLLTCWRQALYALAWFRGKPDIPRLGRGFGLSQATAYRCLDEAIEVLAEQAPGLHEALERAKEEGLPHLILDGKVAGTDRVKIKTISRKGKTIDLWFSGKTTTSAAISRRSSRQPGSRCGSPMSFPEMSATSPRPATRSCTSCARTPRTCRY
jgi:hypothetical protein